LPIVDLIRVAASAPTLGIASDDWLLRTMNKTLRTKLPVALILLVCFPSVRVDGSAPKDARRATVANFLTVWLVRKDVSAALRYFHPRALSSFPVIDNCVRADYIPDSQKKNPMAVRIGVRKFLTHGTDSIRGNTLRTILFLDSKEVPEQSAYLSRLTQVSFNQPKRDRYWLATLTSVKSLSNFGDDWVDFEKQYDLRTAFVSVVQYRVLNEDRRHGDDVVIMMLWVPQGSQWKIVFVAVPGCSA